LGKLIRSYGFYFVLVVLIVLVALQWSNVLKSNAREYSYQEYLQDLTEGKITDVVIYQNEEAPTGRVSVLLKDKQTKSFNVVNTETAWEDAMEAGISPKVQDIAKPSWFLTTLVPFLMFGVFMFFMMNMMMGQAGGGNNAKMMNFGKSRATMTMNTDGKGTTFKEVAGVAEEKEDLLLHHPRCG